MSETPSPPFELQELAALAKRFVEARRLDEAVLLFELALRLDPRNMGIQLSLAQLKRQRHQPGSGSGPRTLREALQEQLRRDALDAKHFLGLARLFAARGDEPKALEYLEIATAKDLPNPALHAFAGRLLFRRHEFARAVVQLARARRYDPFDRDIALLLGRARYELADLEGALTCCIDGFLLLGDDDRGEAAELRDRIQELRDSLGWSNDHLSHLFRQRQEELRVAFDRLEWHRERFLQERDAVRVEGPRARPGSGRIELAARLRQLGIWSHLADEQVFQLSQAAHQEELHKGDTLFTSGTPGADLYVLEKGELTIQRPTPYGVFALGLIQSGEILGEVNYITRADRSGDAVATRSCQLLRLDARALDALVHDDPALGVQLYWSFWHGLAFKLRCTNEQLRTFFAEESATDAILRLRQDRQREGQRVAVGTAAKVRLFQEQGLSAKELMALATFSRERTYPGGAWIFQEGDTGGEMFVVLEGKVRISKFMGGGEEALAILERGDFFGEMALIDGQPRSADARAHEGPVTVIALAEGTIRDVLGMDPAASLEFLQLLCRLIAKRLREIDDK
ncbi:MAG TPA: cyclic nucleotide-binding domain-containing protein, partial [Thermoanaerobaculia bacterium]|nr:cyclic nucleotide-binding domain-containing protein [Thermoanaerobaculia bacterium]